MLETIITIIIVYGIAFGLYFRHKKKKMLAENENNAVGDKGNRVRTMERMR